MLKIKLRLNLDSADRDDGAKHDPTCGLEVSALSRGKELHKYQNEELKTHLSRELRDIKGVSPL